MNTFKFVGQIKMLESKKDRKFIETVTFDSGWMIERVKFRMICGDSSEFVDLSGGKFKDDTKNTVYTLFRKNTTGTDKEVEKAQVAWKDRFNTDIVEKVPGYKRYTIDLSSDKLRKVLEEKIEKEKDVEARAKLEEELSNALKAKYSYIAQYDFVLKVEELLKAGAFNEGNFVVSGTVEYNYSIKDKDEGRYYRSFVPTNIYRASDDEAQSATGRVDLYYIKDDVILDACENGDIPVSGYLQFYEKMSQENYFVPATVYLRANNEKKEGLQNVVNIDKEKGDVQYLGINVEYFDGSPKEELTLENLDDDSKQLIEWGVKTFDEIKAEFGSSYGDNISKVYFTGLARTWKSPMEADVEVERLLAKPDGKKKEKNKDTKKENKKFDLFAEDDDDDEI